jgi:hypothetical protein
MRSHTLAHHVVSLAIILGIALGLATVVGTSLLLSLAARMRRVRRFFVPVSAATLCAILLARGAYAIGLDVLDSGGSLTSGNGQLTFDAFDATASGSVRSDLSLYDVEALVDGIAITGPISAADGAAGNLFIQFSVRSSAPLNSAQLKSNAAAAGSGSSASVTESFDEVDSGQLFVFATGSGGLKRSDSMTFANQTSLRVSKDAMVDSGDGAGGSISVISRIEQHFGGEAAEPTSILLLGSALAGIAFVRRRSAGV